MLWCFQRQLAVLLKCHAGRETAQQNREGAYVPRAGQTSLLVCKRSQTDPQAVMNTHLRQNVVSIVQHRGAGNTPLGVQAGLPLQNLESYACASGIEGDGIFQTTCTDVGADNVIYWSPVATTLDHAADNCYTKRHEIPTSTFIPLPSTPALISTPTTIPSQSTSSNTTTQNATETPSSSSSSSSSFLWSWQY